MSEDRLQWGVKRAAVWGENLVQAVITLRGHKMRSGLLILGVAIGTATLLAMVSLLFGLKDKIRQDIVAASQPYIMVSKTSLLSSESQEEQRKRKDLEPWMFQELKQRARTLDQVVMDREMPDNSGPPPMIFFQKERAEFVWMIGTSPGINEIFNLKIGQGRYFNQQEIDSRKRVIVLGYGPTQELFPHRDPLGNVVRVGNERYRVIGTFAQRNHITGSFGENFAAVPYTTYQKDFGKENDNIVFAATVRPGFNLDTARTEVIGLMRQMRGLRPGQPNDFEVDESQTYQQLLDKITAGVLLVLLVISSIGLLVGGIGVMNILLISVTERTREVGIRMALGAQRVDVLQQFLVEAASLTALGGAAGAALGYALAKTLTAEFGFPFFFKGWMVLGAVGFSVVVGLVFGLYPANRAARMQPVEALRQE